MTTAKKTTTRSRKTTATRKRSTTATKKPRTVTVKKKTLPPNPMVYEILEAVDSEKVKAKKIELLRTHGDCLLYTSPSPRDRQKSRMPSSA